MREQSLAAEWETQADAWVRWTRTPGHDHHFHRYNWPSFLELVPAPGRATLDLGCGEGRVGVALNDLGHRMTGVDTSPSLADLAERTGAYERVVRADAARLPFSDGSFDRPGARRRRAPRQVHRPLHAWLALLLDAGLVIEDVREPRPTARAAAGDPTIATARHSPTFLHVRSLKRTSSRPD